MILNQLPFDIYIFFFFKNKRNDFEFHYLRPAVWVYQGRHSYQSAFFFLNKIRENTTSRNINSTDAVWKETRSSFSFGFILLPETHGHTQKDKLSWQSWTCWWGGGSSSSCSYVAPGALSARQYNRKKKRKNVKERRRQAHPDFLLLN